MRASVGAVARRSAPAGTPSDSRLTCASSQANASAGCSASRRVEDVVVAVAHERGSRCLGGLGEHDLDGEHLAGTRCAASAMRPASHTSRRHRGEEREALGAVDDGRRARRRPASTSAARSSPCGPRRARRPRPRRPAASVAGDRGAQRRGVGPRAAVHRALAPPRPHLFGHERQVRREQAQQRVERERERWRGPSAAPASSSASP